MHFDLWTNRGSIDFTLLFLEAKSGSQVAFQSFGPPDEALFSILCPSLFIIFRSMTMDSFPHWVFVTSRFSCISLPPFQRNLTRQGSK